MGQHDCDSRQELKPREIQFRIRRRDGQIRWIEHSCQPVTDDQGRLRGFRASNRDGTARKLSEIDLRNAYTKIADLKTSWKPKVPTCRRKSGWITISRASSATVPRSNTFLQGRASHVHRYHCSDSWRNRHR